MNKKNVNLLNKDMESNFKLLANKKIYFGHQSVGMNILDGMSIIARQLQVDDLSIVKITNDTDLDKVAFFHSYIGYNEQSESKIIDFTNVINDLFNGDVDIAFMKFCYLDIEANTDVNRLFEQYVKSMNHLQETYPKIIFVHITVPLKGLQKGPKAWIKRALGRPVVGYEDNQNRERFNQRLREYYIGKQHVFDLAAIESTDSSGERAFVLMDNKQVPYLAAEFTNDGGHLNDFGQKVVAAKFIEFIAAIED